MKKKGKETRKWLIHYFKVRQVQDKASHPPRQAPPCGKLMAVLRLFQWVKKEHLEVWVSWEGGSDTVRKEEGRKGKESRNLFARAP